MTNHPDIFVTETYSIAPATYFKIVARAMLTKIFIVTIIISAVCAIAAAATADLRWLLIALILLFLFIPIITGHIYFSKLLNRQAQTALHPRHLEIDSEGNITEIFETVEERQTPKPIHHRISEITHRNVTSQHLILQFGSDKIPLIIPRELLPPKVEETLIPPEIYF